MPMAPERLQKVLARAGVASRRHAEEVILAGRVTVNGEVVAELGARADPSVDHIAVDGKDIGLRPAIVSHLYYLLHKPAGYVCTTSDPEGRPSALQLVPPAPGLVTVGRLDLETEGLLLITDDGEWANHVSHPRYGVEKEYRTTVRGVPSPAALRRLREGVEIPGGLTAPADVRLVHNKIEEGTAEISLVLHEGHKRQVRFMMAAVGHPVVRLVRVRVGPFTLGNLLPGRYRALTDDEVASIY